MPAQTVEGRFFDEDDPQAVGRKAVQVKLGVCKACNEGWMSDMEESVMATLPALIFGDPIVLDKADQVLLASWAAKTLVNLGFEAHYRADRLYPTALRDSLRTNREPPEQVHIVVASFTGSEHKLKVRVQENERRGRGGKLVGLAPTTTALIGRAAFQMTNPTAKSAMNPGREKSGAVERLWPPSGDEARWPPSSSLDAASFECFSDPEAADTLQSSTQPNS